MKNENPFSLQILGLDNNLHLVNRDQASKIQYDTKSLMPTNIDKTLSPESVSAGVSKPSRAAGGDRDEIHCLSTWCRRFSAGDL